MIPQIILTSCIILNVGVALARYGQPKRPDTYDVVDLIIGPAITLGLLYWGGFYGG